jgi:hypothetical protein
MPTPDMLNAMISEQLEAKLNGNKSLASAPPEPPVEENVVIHLDPDDTVRLENYILKQHVETLTRQLEEVLQNDRRKDAEKLINKVKDDFQDYLAQKYEVNTDTHKIMVDAKSYNLTIAPLGD